MSSLGDNIKIHFAGTEDVATFKTINEAGVKYCLYSCYRYIKSSPRGDRFCKNRENLFMPLEAQKKSKHVIMDSGLYTLMFGADSGRKDEKFIFQWQERMIEFVLDNDLYPTVVECDCQKIIGVNEAWELRTKLRDALPGRRIINVFHYEDGRSGLDKLIEFSDYLAISIPELRIIFGREESSKHIINIAKYIKRKKPDIDIHLLGCTDKKILPYVKWCTSADSTSWRGLLQWNVLNGPFVGHKTHQILTDKLDKELRRYIDPIAIECGVTSEKGIQNLEKCYLSARAHLKEYTRYAGPQN